MSINQDNTERASQVATVGDICETASKTNVWLGPEDDDTASAIDLCNIIASHLDVPSNFGRGWRNTYPLLERSCRGLSVSMETELTKLKAIYQRKLPGLDKARGGLVTLLHLLPGIAVSGVEASAAHSPLNHLLNPRAREQHRHTLSLCGDPQSIGHGVPDALETLNVISYAVYFYRTATLDGCARQSICYADAVELAIERDKEMGGPASSLSCTVPVLHC